jgi:outer membrane protein TolC
MAWVPLLWGGCKISEKTYSATEHTPPTTFNNKGDTTQGNNRSYASFFTDKNLVALIDTAMHNNADYNIALQKVQAAKANYLQRKGDLLPTLELRGSGGQTRFGKYTMDGMGNMTTPGVPYPEIPDYFVGAGASWEVDLWGKLRNKKKAAKLRFLATDAGKNLVATNLIAEVSFRYYTLAGLDEELNIIKKNVKLQETALEIIKLQKEGGRATELAVKQFAALLAKTQGME